MEEIFTMFAAMLSAIFTLMVDSFPMGCCKKRSSQLNVSASTNHKRAKEGHGRIQDEDESYSGVLFMHNSSWH
ncbi:unnamed protein product [Malus baccata var. baccata]